MKLELLLLPHAEADLEEIFDYLVMNANLEVAVRFDDAVVSSFRRLQIMPLVGADRSYWNEALSGIRIWFVEHFDDYLIFYRVIEENVQIVRVLHSSRDIEEIISDE